MKFSNYFLFSCADSPYSYLSKILQYTINEIMPAKDICIKGNTRLWFHSNIIESISKRDKFL